MASLIDVATLNGLIGSPNLVLVDCRFDLAAPEAGRQAYVQGRIPGARYADLNRDLSGPTAPHTGRHPLPAREDFAVTLHSLGVTADSQIVGYDAANGAFAARFWWLARWLECPRVAVLDGGMAAWVAAGGALESGDAAAAAAPAPAAATAAAPVAAPAFAFASAAGEAWLTTEQVVAALRSGRSLLVDARAPERYTGAVEPLDPVAGHVPSAHNYPFSRNLSADGRFLPVAELRRRWLAFLGARDPADVIAMCGSGVTACHNLLALEVAGLSGGKLYAGSWSEWIRDPSRGVARGEAP
jgi:thiosulfate/3-mercaptopyruvate sulfurtransferase